MTTTLHPLVRPSCARDGMLVTDCLTCEGTGQRATGALCRACGGHGERQADLLALALHSLHQSQLDDWSPLVDTAIEHIARVHARAAIRGVLDLFDPSVAP